MNHELHHGLLGTGRFRPGLSQCLGAAMGLLAILAIGVPHGQARGDGPAPGTSIRDCPDCVELVVIPAGSFRMGDLAGGGTENEQPVHEVTIPRPFAIGKYEVTFAEWDACVASGACARSPSDDNWGRGRRPVGGVSWYDAGEFVAWLSERTGKRYRLPSEAEWEYAARAGTVTAYPWGDDLGSGNAVCLSCDAGFVMTKEVGAQPANAFGLYDVIGLQKEWVADCWHHSYEGAPADGSGWDEDACDHRVVRGGSWYDSARYLRVSMRIGNTATDQNERLGFRVARDLQD